MDPQTRFRRLRRQEYAITAVLGAMAGFTVTTDNFWLWLLHSIISGKYFYEMWNFRRKLEKMK